MTPNFSFNSRRNWIKNSFMATAGMALAPKSLHASLLSPYEKLKALQNPQIVDENYWELIKKNFNLLPGLQYFNNASLGPSPTLVSEATNQFRALLDGHPSKYMWSEWKPQKEVVRTKFAELLKVDTEEIALTHNTTEGMNLIASSLDLQPGDEVILGDHEHHTGTIPWKYHQERKGIKLIRPTLPILPSTPDELVEVYRQAITPKTKVISIVHMTNTNGMIMPIKAISQMAHEKGILVAVDGAQTVGMLDFDLSDLECDFYAGSCHKWLFAPKGMGVFYAKQSSQHLLNPMIVCGGYKDESIRRLENYNTRNLPELLGVGSAIDFHQLIGFERRYQRIMALKHYFLDQLNESPHFKVKTPPSDQLSAGIQTVEIIDKAVKGIQKTLMNQYNIDCRPMSSHDLNGLRISLSVFNTKQDVDYLVGAMRELAG